MTTEFKPQTRRNSRSHEKTESNWFLEGFCSPSESSRRYTVRAESFVIGRSLQADLSLESRRVSKNHARLIALDDVFLVEDLNSTNGTYVNGTRISQPTPAGEGDLLQFADMEFRLGRLEDVSGCQTIEEDSMESGWMISQMHQVLNLKQFFMHYQPIIQTSDLSGYGLEALIRSDVKGLEIPCKLFHAASQLGLEQDLSIAARQRAVSDLAEQSPRTRLFVNTHPSESLDDKLIDEVCELNTQLENITLVMEVHESAVSDISAIKHFQHQLEAHHIELAYDDFGAGQSRLRELIEVPPDYVKFDRSMIMDLTKGSSRQRSILETLVKFCSENNIHTIAEGIDNQQDGEACRQLGFDFLQGYHYGRPMPLESALNHRCSDL